MKPANDPNIDYRELVRQSYDACAHEYASSRKHEAGNEIHALTSRLDDGASILDIGCGAGIPIARTLSRRYRVTGVDLSQEMIRLARQNVPDANFICSDIMAAGFTNATFDAAVAFYSIFHLPREHHRALFERIHRWLKPGAYLLCTLTGRNEEAYVEDDFFDVTMFWSNFGLDEYLVMLREVGFEVLDVGVTGAGWGEWVEAEEERHPLVLGRWVG